MSEVISERYELEQLIGRGGMSSVYRAYDRLLERRVALKILHEHLSEDAGYVERFRREARSAAQLGHPNIVRVIDRGEYGGRQFIVFEYVEGETLKDLVQRLGPLPVRQVIEIGLEVAHALAYAHDQGLVHRDVKPQNVLLNGDGQPKVTDFGIARSLDVTSVTQPGTVLGTSDYIAPEQATGENVDAQSDVYSLGVVLYELLTGEVPFPSDNFVAAALRHVNEAPRNVIERRPEVPIRLAAAVDRALAKDPADRFGSMDSLVQELEGCRAALGEEPDADATMIVRRPGGLAPRPREARRSRAEQPRARREAARSAPSRRRRIWPVALGLLLIAGAAAAAIAYETTRGDGSSSGRGDGTGSTTVRLTALTSYDPFGDNGTERDDVKAYATDGNPGTYWTTETYRDAALNKPGVGLMFDARRSVDVAHVTVRSDTPGFTARVIVLPRPDGHRTFRSVGTRVGRLTTIDLRRGKPFRYYVVWITDLGGNSAVHLNEVTASR